MVEQMRQMTARAYVQAFGNPCYRHRRLRAQLLGQPHLELVAFAPGFQFFLAPSLPRSACVINLCARASADSASSWP